MNNQPPSNKTGHRPDDNKRILLRYASLGTQLLAAIGLAVFVGLKADNWLKTSPLLACILPLLALSGIFYKIYRETSRPKKDDN